MGHNHSCELSHSGPVVGAAGYAPASGAYQAPVLLLNYAPKKSGGGDGIRTRSLLVGNEASYSSTTPPNSWLPRQESNLQLAVSKTALRTDTECVAMVQRCGIEPLIHKGTCFTDRLRSHSEVPAKIGGPYRLCPGHLLLARQALF